MGGSSKSKQRVVDYYMSAHFGICLGSNARLRGIYIGEKEAWSGDISTLQSFVINKPDLFGGNQKEGGVVGTVTYLPGKSDQILPANLAGRIGGAPTDVPGYRGYSSLFFTGYQSAGSGWSYQDYNSATNHGGFLWTSNSPIIQSVWAKVTDETFTLGGPHKMIGDDANPAHIIYECQVNDDFGAGLAPAGINTQSFLDAAATLYSEEFGLSMIWKGQSKIEDFVQEVLDHIQAKIYPDPTTGLLELKLLRDDYDINTARIINPDNASLEAFQRKVWGETVNEIVVTWTNPENEQEETVSVQDIGNIANQGDVISTSRPYYGIRKKELAEKVALRDLRQSAYPLASAEVRVDRTFWGIKPGQVIIFNWPENNIQNVVMRVMGVDYGKLDSGKIGLSLLEDIFALNKARPLIPPSTEHSDDIDSPINLSDYQIFTPPAFWLLQYDQTSLRKIHNGDSRMCVLAAPNQGSTNSFNLASQIIDASGSQVWSIEGRKELIGKTTSGVLADELITYIPSLPTVAGRAPQENDWLVIGNTPSSHEMALLGPLTASGWEIYRGMLDTIPKAWTAGTDIRLVSSNLNIIDIVHDRAVGESVNYLLLSNTNGGQLSVQDATTRNATASNRLFLPLRPANLKFNGNRVSALNVSALTDIVITWANRNRWSEDVIAPKYDSGNETPEYKQRTVIRTKTTGGVLIREYLHLWNETTFTIPKSWYAKYSSIIIEVLSERDGFESFSKYSINVSGLANNPAAADPPAAPTPPTPPAGYNGTSDILNWSDITDDDGNKPDDNATVGADWNSNVANKPTTLAQLDSAANTLVTTINTEVTNARNGAATLLAAVQAAALTASYGLITGLPTQTSGTVAPTASATNGSIYRQTDGTNTTLIWVREGGIWKADYNAKSNIDSLTTTVGGHTTSINNLNVTTSNQATSITTLSAQMGGAFALFPSTTPNIKTWTYQANTPQASTPDLGQSDIDTGRLATSGIYALKAMFPLNSSRVYELEGVIEIVAGTGQIGVELYTFLQNESTTAGAWWSTVSNWVNYGAGVYTIKGRYKANGTFGAHTVNGNTITWSGNAPWANPSTAVKGRPSLWFSNGDANFRTKPVSLKITDVTDVATAEANILNLSVTKIDSTQATALINTRLDAVFGAGTSTDTSVLADYLTTITAAANYATITQYNALNARTTTAENNITTLTNSKIDSTQAQNIVNTTLNSVFGAGTSGQTNALANYVTLTNANATYATAANLTTLTSQVGGAFALFPSTTPNIKTWTPSGQTAQVAAPDLSQSDIDTGRLATGGTYALKSMIPLNSARVYEVEAIIQIVAGTGQIGVNMNTFKDDETNAGGVGGANWSVASNWVTYGAGTYTIRGRYKANGTFGTHTVNGNTITWSGNQPWQYPSTATKGRAGIWFGNGDANFRTKPISLKITDVTDVATAEANITQLAATETSHYNSLSTITTNLTAKASAGASRASNSGFDIYTNATGVPDEHSNWSNGNFASRVSDNTGGYAMRLYSNGGDNVGIYKTISIAPKEKVVIWARVKLNSGTFRGAGLHWSSNIDSYGFMSFYGYQDPATGVSVGDGVVGREYLFTQLYENTSNTNPIVILYLMNHYTGMASNGDVSSANSFDWFEYGYRSATQAEIQANKALNDPLGNGTTLNSAITNEQIARVNGDSALSSITTTLTSKLDTTNKNLVQGGSAEYGAYGGANGSNWWGSDTNTTLGVYADANNRCRYFIPSAGLKNFYSANIPIAGSLSVSAVYHNYATNGSTRLVVWAYNSSGVLLGEAGALTIAPQTFLTPAQLQITNWPANATQFRVGFTWDNVTAGSLGFIREIMVNYGTTFLPYRNDNPNVDAAIQGSITETKAALTTLDGRVSLYYGMKLDGNGVTSFELMNGSGVPYGGIAKLTASKFLIYGDTIVSGTITGAAIAAGSITTDKLNIGGTTGARLAFVYNAIKVYDASNIVRVHIGDLTA